MKSTSFNIAYMDLMSELLVSDNAEKNERTGVWIKMLDGAHSFLLDLSDGVLPIAGNRKYFPHIAAAETAWQFMGTKDPTFIVKRAPKLWSKFVEDGELKAAYGWRWRHEFGRDQLALAVKELRNNPTNRQLYISSWDPRSDGLGGPQPKNIPCPVGFTLSRVGDRLNMSVLIRSSDVMVGLPYDVMCYSLTLSAIAAEACCSVGKLHITLAHPHLYEPHWEIAEESMSSWDLNINETSLPVDWSMTDILDTPDTYTDAVKILHKPTNEWNPLPAVIE